MIRAIRILLKTLAATIAACASLALLVYYIVVAVNWHDRQPSALAEQWRQHFDNRAALADADNAYGFAMAFGDPAHETLRDPAVQSLREACRPGGTGCTSAFDNGDEAYDRWMTQQNWLLPRYQQLISLPGWFETGPLTEVSRPLPKFGLIMDGQRVLLLQARRLSLQGD